LPSDFRIYIVSHPLHTLNIFVGSGIILWHRFPSVVGLSDSEALVGTVAVFVRGAQAEDKIL